MEAARSALVVGLRARCNFGSCHRVHEAMHCSLPVLRRPRLVYGQRVSHAALLTLGILAAVPGAPAIARDASDDCPRQRGTIATAPLGRVWHRGTTLYGCTAVYGHRPRTKRLGSWSPTTRVSFDGVNVAWTVRCTVGERRVDRIWAANIDSGVRWLKGAPLIPRAGAPKAREERAQLVQLRDQGVAWVTQAGDVVFALRSPESSPEPIGGAAPKLSGQYVLLGSFTALPARDLAATLTLKELPGDGDECGAVNPYELTVQPDANQPALGVRWDGYWSSTNCS